MKIKEVCRRTELTERTVRYYVEEKLLNPQMTVRNGREYREYSEQDVAELITIAQLRKLFFTIDEIKDMKSAPDNIAQVVESYKLKLASDATAKAKIVEAIDQLDRSAFHNIGLLAENLKELSASLPLPQRDIEPNFGRFESGSKAQREYEYQQFLERQAKQYTWGKIIIVSIASLNIIFSLISFALNFNLFSLIIQVVLSFALLAGVTWVRYLFVAGSALGFVMSLMLLINGYVMILSVGWIILIILQMLFAAASSVLLLKSEAVSEFLYSQKNG